ncbi:LPXTG cell wall anchor domain-containing protein [Eremococcus coleocola]|uniref:LPXTG-motif cell wall anchor domain protein n=1 Tax=Eremococcus coleocola ACS-139-V-Col8 TaxID=908337 RepID=E4KM68_9LACT|nr:LPXTG cell wall anchor domain-containing protein [Eremococcus coleocola]EFR31929.1 LPXTG-motif cell wall anchor domain protein [Eremococcus coleocola ACS-139-V-Col8]
MKKWLKQLAVLAASFSLFAQGPSLITYAQTNQSGLEEHRGEALPEELIGTWEDDQGHQMILSEYAYEDETQSLTLTGYDLEVKSQDLRTYILYWDTTDIDPNVNPQPIMLDYNGHNYTITAGYTYHRQGESEETQARDLPVEMQGKWQSTTDGSTLTIGPRSYQIDDQYTYIITSYTSQELNDGTVQYTLQWDLDDYIQETGQTPPGPQAITLVFDPNQASPEGYVAFEAEDPNTDNSNSQADSTAENTQEETEETETQTDQSSDQASTTVASISSLEKKEAPKSATASIDPVTPKNQKGFLPNTGESGSLIMIIGGVVVLGLGIFLLLSKKKSKH